MKDARPKSFQPFSDIHLGLQMNVPNKFYDKGFMVLLFIGLFFSEEMIVEKHEFSKIRFGK